MNFLAHLYLTKDLSEKVSIGNFIADAVKGQKAIEEYDEEMQLGIRIHREIDSFTDQHALFLKGTKRLHEKYRKFSGIIMDIFYDHILAIHWDQYSELSLRQFATYQYDMIERHKEFLPDRTRLWFDYMRTNDLLFTYSKEETIDITFERMDKRTGNISGMSTAINELRLYKEEYSLEFGEFFEAIKMHIESTFSDSFL